MRSIFVYILFTWTVVLSLPFDDGVRVNSSLDSENFSGIPKITITEDEISEENSTLVEKVTRNNFFPGMTVTSYSIEIQPNGNSFNGRALLSIVLEEQGNFVVLYAEDMNINRIQFGITASGAMTDAGFAPGWNGEVEIFTPIESSLIYLIVEYTGTIRSDGTGLYRGFYDDESYLAMNLYPTFARRVFPCVDEPNSIAAVQIVFTNTEGFTNVISNAGADDLQVIGSTTFKTVSASPHVLGLVAHNFQSIGIPGENLRLFGRAGMNSQSSYAAIMFARLIELFEEYTTKPYAQIDANSKDECFLLAMPDITHEWMSLSAIGMWEPYVLLNDDRSAIHQAKVLTEMSNAIARQWFGYVIFPENWIYTWITTGLQVRSAYTLANEADTELDMNAAFVTDIIHKALRYDGFGSGSVLQADNPMFEAPQARATVNGIVNYKAPAVMNMLMYGLGPSEDFLRSGAVALLQGRALQPVNSRHFNDAINSAWFTSDNKLFLDANDFLSPWLNQNGYPFITVTSGGFGQIVVTQERFSYMPGATNFLYNIPLTWTVSYDPNFDNLYPMAMLDSFSNSWSFAMALDLETNWIIFNLQRQGMYRVNYVDELWWRLVEALNDPDQRALIHPLNHAQLVDDAWSLARAGRLDYEIAVEVAVTVGLVSDYHVLKAGLDTLSFMRYPMEAAEGIVNDQYRRMVRRMVLGVERDLGYTEIAFEPLDHVMARAVAMEYACRAGVTSCVAAALDQFVVGGAFNTDVSKALRPAVYCTNVRESGQSAIDMLLEQYEVEQVAYEKLVILKSLACSSDESYISSLLAQTLDANAPFGTGERMHIFNAVVESSLDNARIALRFIMTNVNNIKAMYGGSAVFESMIEHFADHIADVDMLNTFVSWINSINSNLGDSQDAALQYANRANELMYWVDNLMFTAADWIDENDATTSSVSIALFVSCLVAWFISSS